jgi:TfoX/Sxy family transcriptional regulator of competence genes
VDAVNEGLEILLAKLEGAATGLSGVTKKRMFGCDGLFANGNIFGLVWKEGRIGVRLPNEIAYAEAMKMPGSSPWRAGTMTMSHWVLVPPGMHDDAMRLTAWVRRAHALALNAPKGRQAPAEPKAAVKKAPAPPAKILAVKAAKPAKKAAPKRTAAKRPAPKKAVAAKRQTKKK